MGGLKFYNFCSKDTVKFKVITNDKITYKDLKKFKNEGGTIDKYKKRFNKE